MSHPTFLSKPLARCLLGLLVLGNLWHACQTATAAELRVGAAEVRVGIEGHYRVGRWTGVRIEASGTNDSGSQSSGSEEPAAVASLETRDGDGVEVRYVQPPSLDASAPSLGRWNYVVPGSEAAPLIVRGPSEVIASTRFPTVGSPSRGPAMIPLDMPWLVVVGDPLGVDQIGANELLDRDALVAVSQPDRPADLPDSSLGYDGVDMMMLGGSSRPLLAELSEPQQRAIAEWIVDGGRLFLTLGETGPELLQAAPWLESLLPLGEIEVVRLDPSAIETFTSSQTPLTDFSGVRLPKDQGRVLIMGRTTRRVSTPIAVEFNVGFGRITVVAADLENELFAQWPERLDLVTQLTGSILVVTQDPQARKVRSTAYNDLAGQVRASLDQFKVQPQYGFSMVSLILLALIAAIGPLDYLLLNRLLGRPLLGWLTFPLVALGLSAVLVYQARPHVVAAETARATDVEPLPAGDGVRQCNRIEIVDVDSDLELGRGFSVNYLYSHQAVRADVRVDESDMLKRMTRESGRKLTVPFGYPGEAFGGIQIAVEDSRLPVYDVAMQFESAIGDGQRLNSELLGMPLASRSSKGLVTRWRFVPQLSDRPSIRRRPGSELLQGSLVNPLPVDLLNGMLIYRNWTYLLPTRFPAGGRIATVETLRQKNFRWQLSRKQSLENETETEAWDPAATDAPDRITEMLMFHDAVGGTRYTSLRHDPLAYLDLSHVLTEDRCILIGRVAEPATRLEATINESAFEPTGDRLTVVRVVLPVVDPLRSLPRDD